MPDECLSVLCDVVAEPEGAAGGQIVKLYLDDVSYTAEQ